MAFSFFKKKKEEKSTDDRYINLVVREVIKVTKDAANVVFEVPDSIFEYTSGQFITLIDTVKGKKVRRAYSLCTSPFTDKFPAVTVKRVPDGLLSNHIFENYQKGRIVQAMRPMGLFTTMFDSNRSRMILLFGGGSGITPLYSIAKSVLHKEPDTKIHLIYANRSFDSIIFREEINEMEDRNPNFKVTHVLEESQEGFQSIGGRLTTDHVKSIVSTSGTESEIFICGPQPMMDIVKDSLKSMHFPDIQVFLESFTPGVTSPEEAFTMEKSDLKTAAEVTILLDGESYSLTLQKNRSILDQALDHNLDMPYSCQSGLCTACRGKVLEGEVSIDKAEGLSESELEQGYVLTCVGKPISDVVKVEMG